MKAAVWKGLNQVDVEEVAMPKLKKGEVLLLVKSAGVCATDIHIITGNFSYGTPPHILGHEIAGEIVEIGEDVSGWKIGDRVVVETMVNCGDCYYCKRGMKHLCDHGGDIGFTPYQGGYAEYISVPARCIYSIPDSVSFDEAGILESFICPAGSIYRVGMQFGDTVVIQGAGPAGMAYIQTAKACGAGKVIMVARNKSRLAQAEKFGADIIIDIQKEDVMQRVMEETEGRGADISIEAAGFPSSIDLAVKLARKDGKVIMYGIPGDNDKIDFPVTDIILRQISIYGASANPHVWEAVLKLAAKGKIDLKGMVTHTFTLDDFLKAIDLVSSKRDGVIKAVINP